MDHCRRKEETQTEYIGRALRALKRFGRRMDLLVIIVAHPSKAAIAKRPDDLSLYDIADTANFANKADHGVILARRVGNEGVDVLVRKVRYQTETGRLGSVAMVFNKSMGLFELAPP